MIIIKKIIAILCILLSLSGCSLNQKELDFEEVANILSHVPYERYETEYLQNYFGYDAINQIRHEYMPVVSNTGIILTNQVNTEDLPNIEYQGTVDYDNGTEYLTVTSFGSMFCCIRLIVEHGKVTYYEKTYQDEW